MGVHLHIDRGTYRVIVERDVQLQLAVEGEGLVVVRIRGLVRLLEC